MTERVSCFLPCRAGSQRIPRKNIKPFAKFEFGLIEVKLKQLLTAKYLDEVVLSTDDDEIIDYAKTIKHKKLRIHHRESILASSETSTDELAGHALDLIPEGHILWTHVTSPFINSEQYNSIVDVYFEALKAGYDSLMTTTELYAFLWQDGQPLNYDRTLEKWPRTQTLKPVHEVNSAVFIAPSNVYKVIGDRIGRKPYLHTLDKLISHDIDWQDDFILAECMVREKLVAL
jgi:CMP-N-acetylneuraminic acid synthetase